LTTLVGEVIAIDIEVHEDKELSKYGPGSHRHYLDGDPSHILGVALSDGENDFYYPYSKELFDWLREIQGDHLWVGHNILYDLSWLRYEGFKPQRVADTMGLVRLIHEDRQPRKGFSKPYSLDTCAFDFLGERKNEKEMQEWCHRQGFAGAPQKWLRKMPVDMVARYAKKDTRLTFRLYHALIGRIDEQRLNDVWEIEKALLPILSEMHHRGIRIDDSRRQEVSEALSAEISELKETLVGMAGVDFNTNSAKQLAPIFDKLGIPYKHTEKGNPRLKQRTSCPMA
jgi:DNA polymerase I-like protein with 3'-5' exonuclease and polymerase domains